MKEYSFRNDIAKGMMREYYENGILKEESLWLNNDQIGAKISYHGDGRVVLREINLNNINISQR
jgi:antitoxin component YwqK of YwqJK toxin-antitoxin module